MMHRIPNDRSIPLTSSMGMGPRGNGIYVSSQIYDDNPEKIYMHGIGDFITDQRSSAYQIRVGDVVVFKTINSYNVLRFNVGLVENVSNGMVTFSSRQEINVGTMQELADGSVTEDKLADHTITAPKIALGAIIGENIADDAVSTPHIQDGAITEDKLSPSVTMVEISNDDIDLMMMS